MKTDMNLIKNIFFITLISVATMKIIDLTFGKIKPSETIATSLNRGTDRSITLREFNRNQSATIYPSNQYMLEVDSLEQKIYKLSVDSNGFIENGNLHEENPSIRIIFFGGSTTESIFVETKNRFPSIVERSLRKELNEKVVVHNAGVSGNHSMHSNLALVAKGIPLKPNFAVLMHNINDLALLSKTESYWIAPSSRTLVKESPRIVSTIEDSFRGTGFFILKSIKNFLFPNLYSYLLPRLFPNLHIHVDEFKGFRNTFLDLDEAEDQFYSSLATFIDISRSWNIEPVLMTQFNRVNTEDPIFKRFFEASQTIGMSPEQFVSSYKRFNDVIRDVARQYDVELIDLDILIPSSDKFLYDTVHLNDNGSKKVGEVISEHFIEIISSKSE